MHSSGLVMTFVQRPMPACKNDVEVRLCQKHWDANRGLIEFRDVALEKDVNCALEK